MLHLYRQDEGVEYCFNVETNAPLTGQEVERLRLILADGFIRETVSDVTSLIGSVVEVGPRMNFETAWSTNMVAICRACGLDKVTRIERSRLYMVPSGVDLVQFASDRHDRMVECRYLSPIETFTTGVQPEPLQTVPLLEKGQDALKEIAIAAFDDFERQLIYDYFAKQERRNPTMAEILDWANAMSEHCRHWLFRARWIINGVEMLETLFDLVKKPWLTNPGSVLFAFDDNSGAIRGGKVLILVPSQPDRPSPCVLIEVEFHPTNTAETHNFPTAISALGGAETGILGEERDGDNVRRGARLAAGAAGYGVGNLCILGYPLPWEDPSRPYLPNLETPLRMLIDGSGGVHVGANQSGRPGLVGFVRSTDIVINGERWAPQKPVLYSGGVGLIDGRHCQKNEPQKGMKIIQIGGPAYRVGVGGGAASSKGQGDQALELDFNAVQRGNAEMARRGNRVVYDCVCLGDFNPIEMAHDQGAGGVANATKEAVGMAGGKLDIRKVNVGDPTMSTEEIYVAEFQERECFLIWPENLPLFQAICEREKCPCEVLGEITGDGRFVVVDSSDNTTMVDLDLKVVSGDLPQKTYQDERKKPNFQPLDLSGVSWRDALNRVLRLPSVASKGFLVKNVDRSVKGQTAQQQCCGPLQLTVADFGASAWSHYDVQGTAFTLGEKSFLMLGDPAAGARMAVAEALTNLAGASIGGFREKVSCRANWMWAPKLPGEGAALYDAAKAMSDLMLELGINITGGKDSSSMFSRIQGEIVKSPRELVIKAMAVMPDICVKATPDLKKPGKSALLFLDLARGKRRLGGSALAQVYEQIGNEFPDVVDSGLLLRGLDFVQELLKQRLLLSCHDVSDGGLVTTLLEMAFAGNCGFDVEFLRGGPFSLFAEEQGLTLEVEDSEIDHVFERAKLFNLEGDVYLLGRTTDNQIIRMGVGGESTLLKEQMTELRAEWEETSYQLDRQRTNPEQADEERRNSFNRPGPKYQISFMPKNTPPEIFLRKEKPKAAILRDEGTNGEEEMRAAFQMAGFEVWDVAMTDLLAGRITLEQFRILAVAGGFSFADVPDSAKGMAATVRFNERLARMFGDFYHRPDTLSFGVCNGCQWMALLGWVPWQGIPDKDQPRFIRNKSGIFESRWATVKILPSPAIMLQGMEGSTLGIWVAHGEGQLYFPNKRVRARVLKDNLAPIRFVDDGGQITGKYPFNPNGSPLGITALCSPDGRHLAMMPHPERCFLMWQWPWVPPEMRGFTTAPWLRMFQNARRWCEEVR